MGSKLPTSTFTSLTDGKSSRPKNRLLSSILLDSSIEALAVSSRFVNKVGDPATLPVSMKSFGYRILDGSKHVVLRKQSTKGSRALEWETTASARRATAELLTRILLDEDKVEVAEGEKPSVLWGAEGGERDEGNLLLKINNRGALARFGNEEEKKDSSPNRARAQTTKEAKLRSMTHKTSMSFRTKRMNAKDVPEIGLVYRINAWYPAKVIGESASPA
jgi:hypothetical protein